MLAVAVFATGAAAFGSIYLHSTDELVLRGSLDTAPPAGTGLTFVPVVHATPEGTVARLARSAPEPGRPVRWWGRPIFTETAGFLTVPSTAGSTAGSRGGAAEAFRTLPYGTTRPFAGTLVARTGECAHLAFVAGSCPKGRSVAVSTRTAALLSLHVGRVLDVRFPGDARPIALRIAGIYRPGAPSASFWWGHDFFPFGSLEPRLVALVQVDDVFATSSEVRASAPTTDISAIAQLPYRGGSLNVDELGRFESSLTSFEQDAFRKHHVRVHTALWNLFGHAGSVEHASATVVDVADLELVLLGVFVLYFVASRTAAEREPDVRLAELRGFRPRSMVAVALAEPVAIVAAAAPLGLLVAWLVAGATAPAIFGQGIGVSLTPLAVASAVAAGAAGILAAGLGARRSLAVVPGASVDQVSRSLGRSRWAVLGDIAVVALAGAAFFELVVVANSGNRVGGSDPLAALAPGLLAAALGVIAARLVPRILGATHLRTAFSARVSTAFASRTVARRREYAAQLVLAALAVALATFAVSGWVIAGRNRDLRAELGVGAPTVLGVSVRPGTTFVHAVRAADPSGRNAMAVVVERARDGTTLALDTRRLADVATWPSDLGLGSARAARLLAAPRSAPTVWLRGAAVSLTVDDRSAPLRPPPALRVAVFDADTQLTSVVTLGGLQPGTHTYTGPLPGGCPGGCRLVHVSLTWTPATSKAIVARPAPVVMLRILSVAERSGSGSWAPVAAGVSSPQRWTSRAGVRIFATSGALGARLPLNWYGAPVTFGPADVPTALPVVVTPTSASTASGDRGPLVVGLDGETLAGHAVAEVPALPGVGNDAELTSLQLAERYLDAPFRSVTTQVWLSRTAPSSVVAGLRMHGVQVVSTHTAAAAVALLGRSGLNLAYLLYLVSAIAASLVAVATTAFALSSGARRRQVELAALRAIGVDAGALRRAVRVEQGLVLGTGVVVGVVAGIVGAVVALRSVPEFVVKSPGPPLELGLPPWDLVATIGALVVALAVVVVIGSSIVVRGATVDRLAAVR